MAERNTQPQPVLISSEPGLGNNNLAALMQDGSCERKQLLLRFEAGDLQRLAEALLRWIPPPLAPASLQEGPLLAWHLPLGILEAGTLLPDGWPQRSTDPHLIGFRQTLKASVDWGGAVVLLRRLLVQNSRQWAFNSLVGRWLVAL